MSLRAPFDASRVCAVVGVPFGCEAAGLEFPAGSDVIAAWINGTGCRVGVT
jgi:hypothetical protein